MRNTQTKEQIQSLIADYLGGMTCEQCADKYGVKKCTAWEILHRRGLTRPKSETNRRYTLNQNAFDVVTDESAYWIGFLMADGCISQREKMSSRIILEIHERDKPHVEKFKAFLGTDAPIEMVAPKNYAKSFRSSTHARIGVASNQLAEALAGFGVVPRKSKIAKAIGLENNPHFWRGCIDGDGGVFLTLRKLGHYDPVIFLCGTEELLNQFAAFVRTICPDCKAKVTPATHVFQYRAGGCHAIKLAKHLYENAPVALDRKQEKAKEIVTRAEANPHWCNIVHRAQVAAKRYRKWSEKQEAGIMKAYQSGASLVDLQSRFEVTANLLMKIRNRQGVAIRKRINRRGKMTQLLMY